MKNLRLSNFMKFAFIIIFFMIITKEVRSIPNAGPELPPEAPEPNYNYEGLLEQSIPVFCGVTERNSGSFIMTMPGLGPDGSNVSCILGYGLDWQFFYHDGTRIPQENSL